MVDFHEQLLMSAAKSEVFIAETGGLPEITTAAASLLAVIEQTRREIDDAEFASRFPNPPSDNFKVMAVRAALSPMAEAAVGEEGEAGLKRASLRARLEQVEGELGRVVYHLVELRTDLMVSQQEF